MGKGKFAVGNVVGSTRISTLSKKQLRGVVTDVLPNNVIIIEWNDGTFTGERTTTQFMQSVSVVSQPIAWVFKNVGSK